MTSFVTIQTGASSQVVVPFSTAANVAAAQAAMDAVNNLVSLNIESIYQPNPTVPGNVTVPFAPVVGGVVQSSDNTINYGLLPGNYNLLVNGASAATTIPGGSGTAIAVGGAATTLVSGQNATSVFLNISTAGQAFLGGGQAVILNALNTSNMSIAMDGGVGTVFGVGMSTLITGDEVGGSHTTVTAGDNALIKVLDGGSTSVIDQGGTIAVFADSVSGLSGAVTVSAAATAPGGTSLWVGAEGGAVYITPGQADAFIFNPNPGTGETSATLFGGSLGSMSAANFTGHANVLGINGYLEGGSAGGNLMLSGTTSGAATLVAGGSGDYIWLQGANDAAILGDAQNVYSEATTLVGGQQGDTFYMGGGSGTVVGARGGYNTFVFTGGHGNGAFVGNYTVAGGHDGSVSPTSAGFLHGSLFVDSTGGAGTGSITITDFLPQQSVGGTVFDQFSMGSATLVSLTSTLIGGAGSQYNNTAVLSDGTTINFLNTFGQVHQVGTMLQ
jgi:hypothetical protein